MKDAVIVLSHRLEDGKPSAEYWKRLDKAVEIVLGGEAENIILCSETATEAVKKEVIARGIEESRVFLMPKTKDTIGEALFSKKDFLIPKKGKNIFVVSSDYHINYRVKEIFSFVLGKEFSVEFIGIESGKSGDKNVKKGQEKSLEEFRKLVEGISPGDDKAIEERLMKKHRLYSKQV